MNNVALYSNENKIGYGSKIELSSSFLILCLMLPFFEPNIFIKITILNYIFFGLITLETIYLFFKCSIDRKGLPLYLWLILIYRMIMVIVTIINGGDLSKCIYYSIDFFGIGLLIEYLSKKYTFKTISFYILILFSTYLLINLVTILLFPNGIIDGMYFLGIRTRITEYAMVAFILSLFHGFRGSKTIIPIIGLLASIANILVLWVATALIGVLVFLLVYLSTKLLKPKKLNYFVLFLMVMVLTLGIVVFKIQNLFSYLIVDVLGKSMTLSNRTILWDRCWPYIMESPLFGHGTNFDNGNFIWNDWQYMQGHNQIIQSLYETGVIGTAILILFMYKSGKNLSMKNKNESILIAGLICFLIMMISEIYFFYPACWLFFIFSHKVGQRKKGYDYK